MSTQEKITQLALAALRSAPPSAGIPKPATFMPAFEKPKSMALVAGAREARCDRSGSEHLGTGAACFHNPWPFARHEVWI